MQQKRDQNPSCFLSSGQYLLVAVLLCFGVACSTKVQKPDGTEAQPVIRPQKALPTFHSLPDTDPSQFSHIAAPCKDRWENDQFVQDNSEECIKLQTATAQQVFPVGRPNLPFCIAVYESGPAMSFNKYKQKRKTMHFRTDSSLHLQDGMGTMQVTAATWNNMVKYITKSGNQKFYEKYRNCIYDLSNSTPFPQKNRTEWSLAPISDFIEARNEFFLVHESKLVNPFSRDHNICMGLAVLTEKAQFFKTKNDRQLLTRYRGAGGPYVDRVIKCTEQYQRTVSAIPNSSK